MGIIGWAAAPVSGIHSPQSLLSAAALAGPVAVLAACHLATGRSGRSAHR